MAKNYKYKKATIPDIDELVKTRIIVLRAANKLSNDVDMSLVEKESYEYYKRALETGEHIAFLVYNNGAFVDAGGVSFYQVMPTYHNSTGKKAYIMNMYTASEYRRQGIAFHTLDLLVKDVRKQGVSQITLEATEMGRPLYEKYGFIEAIKDSGTVFNRIIEETLSGIKQLVTGKLKRTDMSGPIGIIKVVGDASKGGLEVLTWLTILLSVNIGIFNLLPFPALDGGRIIFVILEIIGIKVDKKLEEKVHIVGMMLLFGMLIYATGNDIMNMMEK